LFCGKGAMGYRNPTMRWYPRWVWLVLPASYILSLILTKQVRIFAPLCEQHKNHWKLRNRFLPVGLILLPLLLLAQFFGAGLLYEATGINAIFIVFFGGWLLLAVSWLAVSIYLACTRIHPTEITDHSITLRGVSQAFVDAMNFQR